MKFSKEDISAPDKFKYLYNTKEFVPGKSTVYYSAPYWDENEINAVFETMIHGKWLSAGENVHKFEVAFSRKFKFKSSLMVNSGSSANLVLISSLKKFFKWNDGDEVIISVVGFPTTLNPLIQNNLKPVFVDITLDDLNWDISQIESKITSKTKAIFSSPVLGNPYNMDEILKICEKYDLKLITDNCDSLGSKWKGKFLTDYGVGASCSFYASHHLSTMEGGMVSFHDDALTDLAKSFSSWGRDCWCVGSGNLLQNGTCGNRFDKWLDDYDGIVDHKYVFSNIGYNLKPLDLQGAVGLVQLTKFDEIKGRRRINKEIIGTWFEDISGVRIIRDRAEAETSWFGVPVICDNRDLKDELVKHLENNKIQTRNYFSGNILIHPGYKHLGNFKDYPEANKVLERVFFVGCAPHFTDDILMYIKKVISDFKMPKKLKVV